MVESRVGEQLENSADLWTSNKGKEFFTKHEDAESQNSQMDREIEQKQSASSGIAGMLGLCEVEAVEKATFKEEGSIECDYEEDEEEEKTGHPGGGVPWHKHAGVMCLDVTTEDGDGASSSPPSSKTDQHCSVAGSREPGSSQQKLPMILCPECGILSSPRLQDYRRCEHNFTVRCQECDKLFVSESGLMLHQKLHSQDYSFPCKFCLQPFKTRLDKLTHEKGHRFSDKEPPYSCTECCSSFTTSLFGAVTSKSPRDTSVMCVSKNSANVAYWRDTRGPTVTSSQACRRSFAQASRLRSHMCTHKGKRLFQCQHCNRSFNDYSLRNHVQRCHGQDSVMEHDGGDGLSWWTEGGAVLGGGEISQTKPLQQEGTTVFRTRGVGENTDQPPGPGNRVSRCDWTRIRYRLV
ncbi:hypothetical protein DPEC_G00053900 [Dallia pectoralis]|uniref:Uncharacterized protein n=1 Tax=Dallia pectoralis TaxID=75939 RepID=A0ACC2H4W2_DALPE|nr:hypothetical protein DPEC_G00053900 [Dallia pectoralis]